MIPFPPPLLPPLLPLALLHLLPFPSHPPRFSSSSSILSSSHSSIFFRRIQKLRTEFGKAERKIEGGGKVKNLEDEPVREIEKKEMKDGGVEVEEGVGEGRF